MKEYIERAKLMEFPIRIDNYDKENGDEVFVLGIECVLDYAEALPAADVVSKAAFDQVLWERDVAIQQLREDYGVGLGEKKAADVVERKRGRWLEIDGEVFECDMCHRIHASYKYDFCPECGADMRSHHDSLCDQTEEVDHETV